MKRPNVLYVHSHDTGRYIQPYGYAVPTPNLQRLAEQGVVFRQAFCCGPTCSPSRAALLTGQCPHRCGMIGLAHRGFGLNDPGKHLVHTLRRAGYTSTLAGFQHVAKDAALIGYDKILETDSHRAEDVAPAATAFLQDAPSQPFFLSVGFTETHREFAEPGPAEDERYCRPPQPLPDTPQTRRDMASFMASARIYDQGVGAVLEALEASDLADDTLVIATTDHGVAFPGMKCNLTDHGIGVMLIMRGPGGDGARAYLRGGRVCDALVSQLDVFPTICDLIDVDPPDWLEGKSLLPVLDGRADEVNEAVFAEVTYHAAYEPQRAVRTRRWKYIRRYDDRRGPVLPNCDDSVSKDVWLAHGWADRDVAAEQLYDLVFDPNEAHNLADDPAAAGALDEMRERMDRWMQSTDDPLLGGPVPAPPGAKVNDPDGRSPSEPPHLVA